MNARSPDVNNTQNRLVTMADKAYSYDIIASLNICLLKQMPE